MGMQNSGWQSAGARLEDLSNIWTFSGGAPDFARFAARHRFAERGASSVRRDEPDHLRPGVGPILSNGGAITVTKSGSITQPERRHRPRGRRCHRLLHDGADQPRRDQGRRGL